MFTGKTRRTAASVLGLVLTLSSPFAPAADQGALPKPGTVRSVEDLRQWGKPAKPGKPACEGPWEIKLSVPQVRVIRDGDTHRGDPPGEWRFSAGVEKPADRQQLRTQSKQVNDGEVWRLNWAFRKFQLKPNEPLVLLARVVESDRNAKTTAEARQTLSPKQWKRLIRERGRIRVRFSGNGDYPRAQPVAGEALFLLSGRPLPAKGCGAGKPTKPRKLTVVLKAVRVIKDGDTHRGDPPGEWVLEARARTTSGQVAGKKGFKQVNDGELWRTNWRLVPKLTLKPGENLRLEIKLSEADKNQRTEARASRVLRPEQWQRLAARRGTVKLPFSGNGSYPRAQPVKGIAIFQIIGN